MPLVTCDMRSAYTNVESTQYDSDDDSLPEPSDDSESEDEDDDWDRGVIYDDVVTSTNQQGAAAPPRVR